jgi:hypothetical protein
MSDLSGAKNPILSRTHVTDIPAAFVADPFMIKEKNRWLLFFEVMNAKTFKGEIGLATSVDLSTWKYEKIVLRELFHLSYPYTFLHNGSYYLVPESRPARSVRLYKASSFPLEWGYERDLISGGDFADPSLFFHDGCWWMFVLEGSNNLCLFFAEDLLGEWRPHPHNPIIKADSTRARPGGRVTSFNGALIRYAQNCVPHYGYELRAFHLEVLTKTSYQERECLRSPVLSPVKNNTVKVWNDLCMHHIDPFCIGEATWVACVDGATDA